MSRVAAVHLSELRFGKLGHMKDGSQTCLVECNSQKSVNLQLIKNTIYSMIYVCYA